MSGMTHEQQRGLAEAQLGKLLAWLLRHEPEAIGLELDPAGWVGVDELLDALVRHGRAIDRAALELEVARDDKQRFTLSPDRSRIRAAQGHSIAVELGLAPREPPERLYHGTPTRFVAAILEQGLRRGKRHHVHLSPDPATATSVGRRRGRPVVLEIAARAMHDAGLRFYCSDNGVWLTDRVPPAYLSLPSEPTLASQRDPSHESRVSSPTAPEELRLALPDLDVAARAWGRPEGRPVLAMHGWLDNAASFDRLAPLLCSTLDLRIVALDLPGHGRSDHKPGHYHFIDSVADALAAADALGWTRFALLGHSMGAGIATLVAGTAPERIDRCVLIEGLGPLSEEPQLAAKRLARSLRVEQRKHATQEGGLKKLHASHESAAARLIEAAPMQLDSARILVARGLVEQDGGFEWRADPRLRIDSRLRMSEEHVHAFLRAIACPTLLIVAEQGWPTIPAVFAARTAAITGLELVRLPGRHHLHLDDPEPVAALLRRFFA
jgi:RNA:NAD 2'-phosphotransferase (TPT1/KptA family)/pimeloyl-ACP methyl ester carboxylesterase